MRFEGDETEEELPTHDGGLPWYFFVPPGMVGVWLLVGVARLAIAVLVPVNVGRARDASVLRDVFEGVDLFGGLAGILLFVFYFALLSRRRRSRWWAFAGLCCVLTLPLYVALLFLPSRRTQVATSGFPEPEPFGNSMRSRVAGAALRDSFVCEGCDSLLNYGVSQCRHCGERYVYFEGTVQVDDSPRRRGE